MAVVEAPAVALAQLAEQLEELNSIRVPADLLDEFTSKPLHQYTARAITKATQEFKAASRSGKLRLLCFYATRKPNLLNGLLQQLCSEARHKALARRRLRQRILNRQRMRMTRRLRGLWGAARPGAAEPEPAGPGTPLTGPEPSDATPSTPQPPDAAPESPLAEPMMDWEKAGHSPSTSSTSSG
jgi:hypothetical protein